ncbi:MAG: glutamate-5-semialdehyde dehydrogenase [Peptococcaceae bacterium]|nr:glutamate-5-semialdehyde dehydrogenase [Candidatus Syntrophopropionicum ammoniitolerans]
MGINEFARQVKNASITLAAMSAEQKNKALQEIAVALVERQGEIIEANQVDLARSEKENLAEPLLKRLKFDADKIADVVEGINSLIGLEDPVGKTLAATELDEDLELYRVTCPIGVIGVIFESRPDALVQISTLCLKSGNGVLLKGGSEAMETNRILADVIIRATEKAGAPANWIKLMETRAQVSEMLKLDEYIDLIIPRGSNEFVRYIMDNSRIPVMGHADGICHCYVDEEFDPAMAVKIVVDSKTQYVAVCNAVETLLVHAEAAESYLPVLKKAMDSKQVQMVGCSRTQQIIPVSAADEEDWKAEYLDYQLAVRVVDSLDQAIEHINRYGSGHTDSIITTNRDKAARFVSLVDSGNVFWNCSTRFSDGFRYGLGAEVGISTNKVHARGPVGLDGLVIYKYILLGNGQTVTEYAGREKTFKHREMDKTYHM